LHFIETHFKKRSGNLEGESGSSFKTSVASHPPTYRHITENRNPNALLFSFQNNFSSRYRYAYWGRDVCCPHMFVVVNWHFQRNYIFCVPWHCSDGSVYTSPASWSWSSSSLRTYWTRLLAREHGDTGNLHAHDGLCDWPLCVYNLVSDDNWPIHGFSTCVPRHIWLNIPLFSILLLCNRPFCCFFVECLLNRYVYSFLYLFQELSFLILILNEPGQCSQYSSD